MIAPREKISLAVLHFESFVISGALNLRFGAKAREPEQ